MVGSGRGDTGGLSSSDTVGLVSSDTVGLVSDDMGDLDTGDMGVWAAVTRWARQECHQHPPSSPMRSL